MKYHWLCTNQQFFLLLDVALKGIKGFGKGGVCSGFLFVPHQPVFSLVPSCHEDCQGHHWLLQLKAELASL